MIPPLISGARSITADSGAKYRSIQLLGTGGNCQVYLTLSLSGKYKGLLFALKLFVRSESDRLARFHDEVAFLETCSHPAILTVYDKGTANLPNAGSAVPYPFVIVDYFPLTLHRSMQGDLWLPQKVIYVMQLLSALSTLASQNPPVVHRDIKPQNIFIKGFSCALGDFGLMKRLGTAPQQNSDGDEVFKISPGAGMPKYFRTPDLVSYARNDAPLTCASDVFQLGLVAAILFCEMNPLKKSNDFLDPVELHALPNIAGSVGPAIRDGIETMLVMNPEERGSVSSLLEQWESITTQVVDQYNHIEGRVF